jgi:ATP-dependent RNA helicase DDX52/ROK1
VLSSVGLQSRTLLKVFQLNTDDAPYLKSVVNVMKESGCEVAEWMLKLKNPSKNLKKNVKNMPIRRNDIKTTSKYDENKNKKKAEMIQASKRRKLAEVTK